MRTSAIMGDPAQMPITNFMSRRTPKFACDECGYNTNIKIRFTCVLLRPAAVANDGGVDEVNGGVERVRHVHEHVLGCD